MAKTTNKWTLIITNTNQHAETLNPSDVYDLMLGGGVYLVEFWAWCSNSTVSNSVINTALFKSKVVKNLNIYTSMFLYTIV